MPSRSERFTAFLQYSPRGTSEASRYSQRYTRAVKNDTTFQSSVGRQMAIPYAAKRIAQEVPNYECLQSCFRGAGVILVPAPKSAPLVQGGLWPTMNLCRAIEEQIPDVRTLPLLKRTRAVRKSSTAPPRERPTAKDHYETITGDLESQPLASFGRIVIVDDVITRGATLLACGARIREACPGVPVECFALIRTMSAGEIDGVLSPVAGTIVYSDGNIHREP